MSNVPPPLVRIQTTEHSQTTFTITIYVKFIRIVSFFLTIMDIGKLFCRERLISRIHVFFVHRSNIYFLLSFAMYYAVL